MSSSEVEPLGEPNAQLQDLLRALAPQVLGALTRQHDFALAEDATQEALLAASLQWPREGLPAAPRAWLLQVASRRITDHLRAEAARRRREATYTLLTPPDEQLIPAPDADQRVERDDALELLFMCCHPALSTSAAIALTLRAVGGLTTQEIARAFLVPTATMGQRISRAKQQIKGSALPFEPLNAAQQDGRLGAALHILYLIFSEGYTASDGPTLQRPDLSREAIRLTRLLHADAPHVAEVTGLLALMLLTDARRAARSGPSGELITLDEQDRSRWDQGMIAEGVALLNAALARGAVGPYQVQAAIAALHDEAASAEDTDWAQIVCLYNLLLRMSDNPMIALNQAIAASMIHGPQLGLDRLDQLERDPRLRDHHRLHAARAHLLERAGDLDAARLHYLRAAERTSSVAERSYLQLRAARA